MRRAPQAGQNPRFLQENAAGVGATGTLPANPGMDASQATSFSWAQSAQRRRRKPWARIPHSLIFRQEAMQGRRTGQLRLVIDVFGITQGNPAAYHNLRYKRLLSSVAGIRHR